MIPAEPKKPVLRVVRNDVGPVSSSPVAEVPAPHPPSAAAEILDELKALERRIVANDVEPVSSSPVLEVPAIPHPPSAAAEIPAELKHLEREARAIAGRDARLPGENGAIDFTRVRQARKGTIEPTLAHYQEAAEQQARVREVKPPRPEMMEELNRRIKEGPSRPSGPPTAAAPKNESTFLKNLTTEQKVHGGLWMLSAALSTVFAWSSAKEISYTDEKGQSHINATAVGLTLVQGLFAAGSLYLGVQALRGR